MSLAFARAGRFSYHDCGARRLPGIAADAHSDDTAGPVSVHATPASQSGRQPEHTYDP